MCAGVQKLSLSGLKLKPDLFGIEHSLLWPSPKNDQESAYLSDG